MAELVTVTLKLICLLPSGTIPYSVTIMCVSYYSITTKDPPVL